MSEFKSLGCDTVAPTSISSVAAMVALLRPQVDQRRTMLVHFHQDQLHSTKQLHEIFYNTVRVKAYLPGGPATIDDQVVAGDIAAGIASKQQQWPI